MEVVTTVPIMTLLLASALAPLVVGRPSFWGTCGYSSDGLGQLEHLCPERSLRSSLVSALCADISRNGSWGKVYVKLENKPTHPDNQQCGSWAYRRRCREVQGEWCILLITVLTSIPLRWYLCERSGYAHLLCHLLADICDTEHSQEGLLILFFLLLLFFFWQGNCFQFQKCFLPVHITQWYHCLSQQNQPAALGHAKSPTSC